MVVIQDLQIGTIRHPKLDFLDIADYGPDEGDSYWLRQFVENKTDGAVDALQRVSPKTLEALAPSAGKKWRTGKWMQSPDKLKKLIDNNCAQSANNENRYLTEFLKTSIQLHIKYAFQEKYNAK